MYLLIYDQRGHRMNITVRYMQPAGFALISTLIMLTIVSILAIAGIQVSQIQEKASRAVQDKTIAFRAAESALLGGETWLLSQATEPSEFSTCSAYPCLDPNDLNSDFSSKNNTWWINNAVLYQTTLYGISAQPYYVIEYIRFVPDTPIVGNSNYPTEGVYYYRLSTHGNGASNDGVSVLQTTVARRY